MDLYTVQQLLGNAHVSSPLASARASSLGGIGSGSMSDQFGSQSFSFASNQPFGTNFSAAGRAYSLRPDFISKVPFGKSWSVFGSGQNLGWIGMSNPATGPFRSLTSGGNLGPRLQSGLLSMLTSTGQGF